MDIPSLQDAVYIFMTTVMEELKKIKPDILLEFRPQPNIDVGKLMQMIAAAKGKYLFTAGANPYLTIKPARGEGDKPLQLIKNFFEALKA